MTTQTPAMTPGPVGLLRRVWPRGGLLMRFVVVVVLVHTPSWLTLWFFQGTQSDEHPLFNLDLLVAAALACVLSWVGGAALVLAWLADLIRTAAKNYHFMSSMDFVDSARFVDMLNLRSYLSVETFCLVLGITLCAVAVLSLTARDWPLAKLLMSLAFLAAASDFANGSSPVFGFGRDSRLLPVNFAGSPSWNVWQTERRDRQVTGSPVPMPNPVTYRALQDWQRTHPRMTSMLVLVESMGVARDPAVRAWLKQQLATDRLMARWNVVETEEAFVGSTTYGELRTLCGLQGAYRRMDEALAHRCLPHQAAARGAKTLGIHGFGLRMFDRDQWWPTIGLKPWKPPADVAANLPMNCNKAFPGICDGAVLQEAIQAAQQPDAFVYALTLDTHLPIAPGSAKHLAPELLGACSSSGIPYTACRHIGQLGRVLHDLEQGLASSEATPFIVIAGDHAPPFGEAANRRSFEDDQVPVFVLTPRKSP